MCLLVFLLPAVLEHSTGSPPGVAMHSWTYSLQDCELLYKFPSFKCSVIAAEDGLRCNMSITSYNLVFYKACISFHLYLGNLFAFYLLSGKLNTYLCRVMEYTEVEKGRGVHTCCSFTASGTDRPS